MNTPRWYLFTFGIPLIGLVACCLGFGVGLRLVKKETLFWPMAILGYLFVTLAPIGLALLAIKYGEFRGHEYADYQFSGEHAWALLAFMEVYLGVAVLANVAFWITLALRGRKGATTG